MVSTPCAFLKPDHQGAVNRYLPRELYQRLGDYGCERLPKNAPLSTASSTQTRHICSAGFSESSRSRRSRRSLSALVRVSDGTARKGSPIVVRLSLVRRVVPIVRAASDHASERRIEVQSTGREPFSRLFRGQGWGSRSARSLTGTALREFLCTTHRDTVPPFTPQSYHRTDGWEDGVKGCAR